MTLKSCCGKNASHVPHEDEESDWYDGEQVGKRLHLRWQPQLKVSVAGSKKWPCFKIAQTFLLQRHAKRFSSTQHVRVMVSHLALRGFFFFFMWEFQTNSAWNVRCVLKMMHLILKSTSQELQYKTDRSPESVALLSIWEATIHFPFFSFSFFFPPTETPADVHLTPSHHLFKFSEMSFVRGDLVWRNVVLNMHELQIRQHAHQNSSPFFFCTLFFFGPWRWRAETPAGLSSVGERAILRGWGGEVNIFGSNFREDGTPRDQVD